MITIETTSRLHVVDRSLLGGVTSLIKKNAHSRDVAITFRGNLHERDGHENGGLKKLAAREIWKRLYKTE